MSQRLTLPSSAPFKRALPLGPGAMREAPIHQRAIVADLQRIVPNLGGRLHRFLHIALFKQLPYGLYVVRPDACKTVRLRLKTNTEDVVLKLTGVRASDQS